MHTTAGAACLIGYISGAGRRSFTEPVNALLRCAVTHTTAAATAADTRAQHTHTHTLPPLLLLGLASAAELLLTECYNSSSSTAT
eukprot:15114-Heterococcus_DN1.PRE.1